MARGAEFRETAATQAAAHEQFQGALTQVANVYGNVADQASLMTADADALQAHEDAAWEVAMQMNEGVGKDLAARSTQLRMKAAEELRAKDEEARKILAASAPKTSLLDKLPSFQAPTIKTPNARKLTSRILIGATLAPVAMTGVAAAQGAGDAEYSGVGKQATETATPGATPDAAKVAEATAKALTENAAAIESSVAALGDDVDTNDAEAQAKLADIAADVAEAAGATISDADKKANEEDLSFAVEESADKIVAAAKTLADKNADAAAKDTATNELTAAATAIVEAATPETDPSDAATEEDGTAADPLHTLEAATGDIEKATKTLADKKATEEEITAAEESLADIAVSIAEAAGVTDVDKEADGEALSKVLTDNAEAIIKASDIATSADPEVKQEAKDAAGEELGKYVDAITKAAGGETGDDEGTTEGTAPDADKKAEEDKAAKNQAIVDAAEKLADAQAVIDDENATEEEKATAETDKATALGDLVTAAMALGKDEADPKGGDEGDAGGDEELTDKQKAAKERTKKAHALGTTVNRATIRSKTRTIGEFHELVEKVKAHPGDYNDMRVSHEGDRASSLMSFDKNASTADVREGVLFSTVNSLQYRAGLWNMLHDKPYEAKIPDSVTPREQLDFVLDFLGEVKTENVRVNGIYRNAAISLVEGRYAKPTAFRDVRMVNFEHNGRSVLIKVGGGTDGNKDVCLNPNEILGKIEIIPPTPPNGQGGGTPPPAKPPTGTKSNPKGPGGSGTGTATPTPTPTPTATPTVTPTATPTVTPTATPTSTPTAGPKKETAPAPGGTKDPLPPSGGTTPPPAPTPAPTVAQLPTPVATPVPSAEPTPVHQAPDGPGAPGNTGGDKTQDPGAPGGIKEGLVAPVAPVALIAGAIAAAARRRRTITSVMDEKRTAGQARSKFNNPRKGGRR